jgi:hypothetical protein
LAAAAIFLYFTNGLQKYFSFQIVFCTALCIQNYVKKPKTNMKIFYEQYFMNVPGPEPALVEN